jgi:hypothetical protein
MLRQDALRVSGQADETGSNRLTSEEVSYIGSGRATSNFELQISDFRFQISDGGEIKRKYAGKMPTA